MEVILEGVDEAQLDPGLLDRGVAELRGRAVHDQGVDLVIADDFAAAVRSRTRDLQEAEEYTTDRLFGIAAAKTLHQAQGSVAVVVNADLLVAGGLPDSDVRRLFAHEGLHVATYQREETLSDIRIRHGIPGMSNRGTFSSFAGIMAEEYRVERALCDEGWWPDAGYRAGLGASLRSFREAILDGITLRYDAEPIERCCQTVLTAFHRFTTLAGYLAAEELASAGARAPASDGQLWDRLVGDSYDAALDVLAAIPCAAAACDRATLDTATFELTTVLGDWLRHIGFTVEDRHEGLYFDVLSHDF